MATEIRAELVYREPEAAIAWLAKAFGFESALPPEGWRVGFPNGARR